jgi:AraC-like DNA-binding protein
MFGRITKEARMRTVQATSKKEQSSASLSLVLEEFTDDKSPMHLVYQKRGEGLCPLQTSDHPMFFFPRCASTFDIRQPTDKNARQLDAFMFAVVPPNTPFQVYGNTAISDSVLFKATPELVRDTGNAYGVEVAQRFSSLKSATIMTRTNWLNEIMHRYVYERAISQNLNNAATRFLEQEIVKEVFYRLEEFAILDKNRFDLDTLAIDHRSPLLRAAMAYVDANLFRDITVTDIARHVGTSESTVLREFQTRLDRSPTTYIVSRRLEEAMILVKSKRYSVSQVSDIVGYENVSAFSAAFKKCFGLTPSQVITKDPRSVVET